MVSIRTSKLLALVIVLLSAFLSFFALDQAGRFHPDEAFYMTIARNAGVNGDWLLLSEPVDKPPLTFYTNAFALVFFAIEADYTEVLQLDALKGEFAGRIPSTLMSVILVAATIQLGHSLTDNKIVGLITGLMMALSPLRLVFAPTAFTDLPMLLFAVLSLWMAVRERSLWAGIWFALSLSAKPQVIFYFPILLIFLYVKNHSRQYLFRNTMRFMLPIIISLVSVGIWDYVRVQSDAESFYLLGQSRYTPTMLAPITIYWSRFLAWWATIQYIFGHGLITASLLLLTVISTIWHTIKRKISLQIIILWGWMIAFFGVHMILTLNLFDRNQLVLVPIVIVVVSQTLYNLKNEILLTIVFLGMFITGMIATTGAYPIGGDDGRHGGIEQLANHLNEKPIATVIYDRWLDWELDYYLGQWTNKRRVFYPTPEALLEGIYNLDEQGARYFVAPKEININDWLDILEDENLQVTVDYMSENFVVYEIDVSD